jgi:hypothetical protein
MEAFLQAAAEFVVADLELEAEPSAVSAAQRSLDDSGLLLLGEVHGVRENPLLIRALMREFGLTSLALEWPDDLAPAVAAFLAGETLADHPMLWPGDGRITAGHLAVLAERAAAGPFELTLFDGTIGAGWSWSQRDEAMAARILAGRAAGIRTLAVAGNAHTPSAPSSWMSRWAPAWRRDGRVSGRYASITAAGVTTTSGRPSSPRSAGSGASYGSTSTMTRLSSTCPRPAKRSCPSDPGHESSLARQVISLFR